MLFQILDLGPVFIGRTSDLLERLNTRQLFREKVKVLPPGQVRFIQKCILSGYQIEFMERQRQIVIGIMDSLIIVGPRKEAGVLLAKSKMNFEVATSLQEAAEKVTAVLKK